MCEWSREDKDTKCVASYCDGRADLGHFILIYKDEYGRICNEQAAGCCKL